MNQSDPPEVVRSSDGLGALAKYRADLERYAVFDDGGLLEPRGPFSWETLARIAVDLANAALSEAAPWDMALCERHSLVLRVGQPYVFRPVGSRRASPSNRQLCSAPMGQRGNDVSTFSGNIGPEEEDVAGWGGTGA